MFPKADFIIIFLKPALFTSMFTSARVLLIPHLLLVLCHISWYISNCQSIEQREAVSKNVYRIARMLKHVHVHPRARASREQGIIILQCMVKSSTG